MKYLTLLLFLLPFTIQAQQKCFIETSQNQTTYYRLNLTPTSQNKTIRTYFVTGISFKPADPNTVKSVYGSSYKKDQVWEISLTEPGTPSVLAFWDFYTMDDKSYNAQQFTTPSLPVTVIITPCKSLP